MRKIDLRVALAGPVCLLALTACKGLAVPVAPAAAEVSGLCDYDYSKPSGRLGLNASQKRHAETIVLKGAELHMPQKGVEVAVTAALQESTLDNSVVGDHGSAFGLFQMRPIINGKRTNWGSYRQVNNPKYAAEKFYRVLQAVKGWQNMSHADAAQAVEASADGSLYRDNVKPARRIVRWVAWERCAPPANEES